MEERLKKLRKSMKETTFRNVNFTEDQQESIRKAISKSDESDEMIYSAILQLTTVEKTGYDLAKVILARGIKRFEDNEGLLYTLLHLMEQKGYLHIRWGEEGAKYYRISEKGRKILPRSEGKATKKKLALSELLEG
ncbi:PadR family transcriptional regulator [Mesobacillus foraminis]|uniref:PadR family transcriptional regulator n=1 Tax=Mesobacillus foraminis TaxID=279826 RepID=UPI001BE84DC7|nr:PadR family transcriptional regulator [Mesobacillus foraminis]MBT2758201.1 PadR family transcriptional regulator [Mesobacillus foraminis]